MKYILALLFCTSVLFGGTIKIAVAANVSYAIEDLKKAFHERFPDIKVETVLGSSGKLTAQIQNGAPYDLFMSANMKYPQALYASGAAVTIPLVYAQGALALVTTGKTDLSKGLDVLKEERIKRIAVANPKTAPYGVAAKAALEKAGLYDTLKPKFVYGESISQTMTYALRAADVGIVAKSALYSPKLAHLQKGKQWVSVDTKYYRPIDQGIVILKQGENSVETAAFYAFIFSKKAEEIFKAYGYMVP